MLQNTIGVVVRAGHSESGDIGSISNACRADTEAQEATAPPSAAQTWPSGPA